MTYFLRSFAFSLICCLTIQMAHAGLMSGSQTIISRADQLIEVTPNSPLTPAFGIPAGTILPLSAVGSFSFQWEDDSDNDNQAALQSFSAVFNGVFPAPYRLEAVGVGPGAMFDGELTNIVESGGQLVTADFTLNTTFSLQFQIPGTPTLYTRDLSKFTGTVRGNGAMGGDVFVSDGITDVFLSTGNGLGDPLAATSFNRTVTAVPEPSTAITLGLLVGLLGVQRRRRNPA